MFTEAKKAQIEAWKNTFGCDVYCLRINPFDENRVPRIELSEEEKQLPEAEQKDLIAAADKIREEVIKKGKEKQAICYVKKPSLEDILMSIEVGGDDDAIRQGLFLMKNLWIDGDERIQTADEYRFAAARQVHSSFEVFSSSLEKL